MRLQQVSASRGDRRARGGGLPSLQSLVASVRRRLALAWRIWTARGLASPALVYALLAGATVRLAFRQDFPLNDGGMFYLMTQELQRARHALPALAAYNEAGIPFAHPPLGLYLVGLLADLGPWSLLDVFRVWSALVSIATIAALYRLSQALLPEEESASLAVLAFALLAGSYTWQTMGGGVTRAPGMMFAILAVDQAYRAYTHSGKRHVALAALFSASALLSHLAMAWAAALGIALLFLVHGRTRADLLRSLAIAGAGLAISTPWWATIIARRGLQPLVAAAQSPEPALLGLASLLTLDLSGEPSFLLFGAVALFGVLACVVRRRYLLPTWLAALFVLDPRAAGTAASVPLALPAGIGLGQGLPPTLRGAGARPLLIRAVVSPVVLYGLVAALAGRAPLLSSLSPEKQEAMHWIAAHTPADSTFVIVTGDGMWGGDRTSEWFPVLAQWRSVAAVQGYEWFEGFEER